ncbi:hypothetical protein ACK1KB_13885 [Chryseobacterium sp. TY3]
MKKFLLVFLFSLTLTTINAQSDSPDKFRVDYNYVSIYDPKTDKWSKWEKGDNTFIININDRGDIAHLMASGKNVIYKKISRTEEGWTTDENEHYQVIQAIDENGDVFRFQLFDNSSIGLKFMWDKFMIQFAKL